MLELGSLMGYLPGFYQIIAPVLFFSAAIVIYAAAVGLSYRTMSKRDIFRFERIKEVRKEHKENPVISFLINFFEYGLIFPVIVIVWFSLFSILLFILSKELSVETLLMISIAIISSTRILSYFNEDIAIDVAKLFPLILLGAFLLEPSFFSIELFYARLNNVPALLPKLPGFVLLPVLTEWTMRILLTVKNAIIPE